MKSLFYFRIVSWSNSGKPSLPERRTAYATKAFYIEKRNDFR